MSSVKKLYMLPKSGTITYVLLAGYFSQASNENNTTYILSILRTITLSAIQITVYSYMYYVCKEDLTH